MREFTSVRNRLFSRWPLLGVVALLTCASAQCGENPGGTDAAALAGHFDAAKTAGDRLVDALNAGTPGDQALAGVAQGLGAGVLGSNLSADGRTLWVVYDSGLECIYDLGLETDESLIADMQSAKPLVERAERRADAFDPRTAYINIAGPIDAGLRPHALPASNKALVANSLFVTQPLQDIRGTVDAILTAGGYQVTSTDLTLEVFKTLGQRQYGVLFFEAHGSERRGFESILEAINNMNTGAEPGEPFVGGDQVLQTCTEATPQLRDEYAKDLATGRLKIRWPPAFRDGRWVNIPYFAVTANFIRKYNSQAFADRTILFLSACSSWLANGTSTWADLVQEKSNGGMLLGWSDQVVYETSARAMLNYLQAACGTNESKKVTSAKTKKDFWLLRQNTPPMAAFPDHAYDLIQFRGYARDPQTQAVLLYMWDTQKSLYFPMLVPGLRVLGISQNSRVMAYGAFDDNASLRIESNEYGLGTYGQVSLPPYMSGWAWTTLVPAANMGRMWIVQEGRRGRAPDLLNWRPKFVIQGTGDHGLTYTITLNMWARGMANDRLTCCGGSPDPATCFWNPPGTHDIQAFFEEEGSAVNWAASGGVDDGTYTYQYSGGGNLKCKLYDSSGNYGSGLVINTDATTGLMTADVGIVDLNPLSIIETRTSDTTGQMTVNAIDLHAFVEAQGLAVGPGLNVAGSSYVLNNETVTWSGFGPQAGYSPAASPR